MPQFFLLRAESVTIQAPCRIYPIEELYSHAKGYFEKLPDAEFIEVWHLNFFDHTMGQTWDYDSVRKRFVLLLPENLGIFLGREHVYCRKYNRDELEKLHQLEMQSSPNS